MILVDKMKEILVVFAVSVMSVNPVVSHAQSKPISNQCKVGQEAPAFGYLRWNRGAMVKVYVLVGQFRDEEIPYLLKPLENWTAVSEATGSGVRFAYQGAVPTQVSCENCLTLMRGTVFDKSRRHATELRSFSAHSDQVINYAAIVFDPNLKNLKALTNAVAHELGHSLGLMDCYTCKEGQTVMSQFKVFNKPNEMEGPSLCDVVQVNAAYQELEIKVWAPAPKTSSTDEGEEPIDDDTPVVIRKP